MERQTDPVDYEKKLFRLQGSLLVSDFNKKQNQDTLQACEHHFSEGGGATYEV